jgi:hypothetical protein
LQFAFGLQTTVAADVLNHYTALGEHTAHEQSTMAAGRILFRAKYGDNGLPQAFFKTRQARSKGAGFSYFAIQYTAIGVVVDMSARPASQFVA